MGLKPPFLSLLGWIDVKAKPLGGGEEGGEVCLLSWKTDHSVFLTRPWVTNESDHVTSFTGALKTSVQVFPSVLRRMV